MMAGLSLGEEPDYIACLLDRAGHWDQCVHADDLICSTAPVKGKHEFSHFLDEETEAQTLK